MARETEARPCNVPGPLYVDDGCIDCGMCRWAAPEVFDRQGGASRVHCQPADEASWSRALQAVVACPSTSIGLRDKRDMHPAVHAFPRPVELDGDILPGVFHCGYHSPGTFGAASWFIVRPEGNILVDSPRFAAPLVQALERLGGVRWMFLTHRDDVADHRHFHEHFGAERVMHVAELGGQVPEVELPFDGAGPEEGFELAPGVLVLPTPGHTEGSACLLLDERVLLTGDSLAMHPGGRRLVAFEDVCWYDWEAQRVSLRTLAGHRFTWILPGHGWPGHASAADMGRMLDALVARMARPGGGDSAGGVLGVR